MNINKVGAFIKELRKEKNITQSDLADYLHITREAVSKWERGKNLPDVSLLQDISNYFNISVNELLNGERIINDTKRVNQTKIIGIIILTILILISKIIYLILIVRF